MNTRTNGKFLRFLRNNIALIIIILSILTIAAVLLVTYYATDIAEQVDPPAVIADPVDETPVDTNEPDTPVTPVDGNEPDPVEIETFSSPLQYTSIGMEYSDGSSVIFVYNSTLNRWASHKAVDLLAPDGTEVTAMKSGTVTDVGTDYGLGDYVVIDHGDGVVATYASLSDVQVVKGDVVQKGDHIGDASESASYEFEQGAHLHLEVRLNGEIVDPMPYVNGEIE